MVETLEVASLPLAPKNPLPYWQQVKASRPVFRIVGGYGLDS